jgi:methionine-rich copper-binding protein CopC
VKYLVGRKRIAAIFALALSIAPSTPTPATAHTKLLSEIPAAGSKVASWPTQITLEFDEQLQNLGEEKANFLVVNNAAGDQVSQDDETLVGNTITVTLSPNQVQGPVLVYYRVVSGDGHPVEGEYTFTYGIGIETAEGVVEEEPSTYPITIYLASAVFIVSGLFFAIYAYRRRSRI